MSGEHIFDGMEDYTPARNSEAPEGILANSLEQIIEKDPELVTIIDLALRVSKNEGVNEFIGEYEKDPSQFSSGLMSELGKRFKAFHIYNQTVGLRDKVFETYATKEEAMRDAERYGEDTGIVTRDFESQELNLKIHAKMLVEKAREVNFLLHEPVERYLRSSVPEVFDLPDIPMSESNNLMGTNYLFLQRSPSKPTDPRTSALAIAEEVPSVRMDYPDVYFIAGVHGDIRTFRDAVDGIPQEKVVLIGSTLALPRAYYLRPDLDEDEQAMIRTANWSSRQLIKGPIEMALQYRRDRLSSHGSEAGFGHIDPHHLFGLEPSELHNQLRSLYQSLRSEKTGIFRSDRSKVNSNEFFDYLVGGLDAALLGTPAEYIQGDAQEETEIGIIKHVAVAYGNLQQPTSGLQLSSDFIAGPTLGDTSSTLQQRLLDDHRYLMTAEGREAQVFVIGSTSTPGYWEMYADRLEGAEISDFQAARAGMVRVMNPNKLYIVSPGHLSSDKTMLQVDHDKLTWHGIE